MKTTIVCGLLLLLTSPAILSAETAPARRTIVVNSSEDASKAIAAASPGEVILLSGETHQDFRLTIKGKGTLAHPITFRAKTAGKTRLTGDSRIEISGEHIIVEGFVFDQAWSENVVTFKGATHCQLTNCAFFDCGDPKHTYQKIITIGHKSSHNRIDHCYMQGNLSIGVSVRIAPDDYQNTHNRFDHNYFKDIERQSGNGQEAVQIGQGGFSDRTSQFTLLEHCLFDKVSGDSEIISNKSSDNIYRFNTFRNCEGMLTLRGGNRTRVEGNFFFNGLGGIRIHGSEHIIVNNYIEACRGRGIYMPAGSRHYAPVNYCVVAHNTIINCGQGIHVGRLNSGSTDWELQVAFNDFLKNLIVINRDVGIGIQDNGSQVSTWRGNIVWTSGGAKPGLKAKGISWIDPLLVKKNDVFRLSGPDSPAVNVASVNFRDVNAEVPGTKKDFDGQARNPLPDVGCDEWSETPIQRVPLRPEEVGPTWMLGDPSSVTRLATKNTKK
ncbi:MAG: polysaccharide lyase 6 family protein [Verrucomicrobiota bacterium]